MLSAYIHIPFCVNKCPYCGFYSTRYDTALADRFLSALDIEMQVRSRNLQDRPFSSIYIGGGTPTMLSLGQFSRLFDLIEEHLPVTADSEITVESNPGTITAGTLDLLKDRGVNRFSIGVQSFSDQVLAVLGRAHSADRAFDAVRAAREAGFGNIGIDLIYGVPEQTEEHWQRTIEAALSLQPEHLSAYSLSLDEGSPLSREAQAGRFMLPDDEVVERMYGTAIRSLAEAGLRQYEISNFCVPGRECRHNCNYWARGEYLGLGPGAWSFIGNTRSMTIADVNEYIARMTGGIPAIDTRDVMNRDQSAAETLFLGLRRTDGIDLDHYDRMFGPVATNSLRKKIKKLDGSGLFQIENTRLSLTMRGFLLSNEALTSILP
ncbi:MAG: radical SAM family heme chaperone HemW [Nitrospirae bacterium]|nr:radical SAM family heme chaperone HemW [Nitrospirota bacterium]